MRQGTPGPQRLSRRFCTALLGVWALVCVGVLAGGCGAAAPQQPPTAVTPSPQPTPPTPVAAVAPAPLPAILAGPRQAPRAQEANLPTEAELNGAWARVFLHANPGPFQYVAYEVTSRAKAGVVSHLRGVMGRRDAIIRTELVSGDQVRRLFARLRDAGALRLPDPPALPQPAARPKRSRTGASLEAAGAAAGGAVDADEPGLPQRSEVPIYELSFRLGGVERTVIVADPYGQSDARYAAFLNEVRSFVVGSVGDIAWHEPTGEAGSRGFLFVDSVPGASVTVDGVKLPDETPVFAYPVSVGVHEVVLENAEHGLSKSYKVRVQPGMTTSLEVDLR